MMKDSLLSHTTSWMLKHGWYEASEGQAGWMWKHRSMDDGQRRIGIARELDADETAFQSVIKRLAAAHQLPVAELDRSLRMWGTDVTTLRAANDIVITDTIPLNSGAVMLESARLMFRSAASAAVRLRPEISGAYSRLGDEVAESVRMGHTQRGSYLIPVYVPVGEPDSVDSEEPVFDGMERESISIVESAERRMTRTFAQAMQAIHEHVITPEGTPNTDRVMALVSAGVTREFISALSRVLSDRAVAEFETQFEWAQSQKKPTNINDFIKIPSAAEEKLAETARRLKQSAKREFHVLTGPIVTVSKFPDDPYVYATIKTLRGGRSCSVEAILRDTPLDVVTSWMNSTETVQLQGEVTRKGPLLQVMNPQSFGPMQLSI